MAKQLRTLIKSIGNDSSWVIYANTDKDGQFSPRRHARIGQAQFVCGGIDDGKTLFADGLQVNDWLFEAEQEFMEAWAQENNRKFDDVPLFYQEWYDEAYTVYTRWHIDETIDWIIDCVNGS
jgi:hypothetical protein